MRNESAEVKDRRKITFKPRGGKKEVRSTSRRIKRHNCSHPPEDEGDQGDCLGKGGPREPKERRRQKPGKKIISIEILEKK